MKMRLLAGRNEACRERQRRARFPRCGSRSVSLSVVACWAARTLTALPFCAAAHAHTLGSAANAWHPHWSFEPWVVLCLAASGGLYGLGVCRLWLHAGRGRGISIFQSAAFAAGWLFLVVALVSPLDSLGDQLFSAHMVQHETLMLLAAPMLVIGRPLAAWAWAVPMAWRRTVGAFFHTPGWRKPWLVVTGPGSAWLLHAAALWLWHLPMLFEAALANEAVHSFQHLTFLFTALLFWWSVLNATTRKDQGIALASLFTTFLHTGALGAILTLAHTDWYPSYAATAPAFGLSALEDQQVGGLIMWIPAGAIYLIGGLFLAATWMTSVKAWRPVPPTEPSGLR